MGKRVEVYWNLHKNCYSVRALTGENKGRVVAHPAGVSLDGVTFAVQPAGRAKTLAQRRKNVHAYVRGTPTKIWFWDDDDSRIITLEDQRATVHPWTVVRYNPYTGPSFVTLEGVPVTAALSVRCLTLTDGKSRLYALNPE